MGDNYRESRYKYGHSNYYKRKYEKQEDIEHNKKKYNKDLEEKDLTSYKYELARFLEEQCNIRNQHDFWQFFNKYKIIKSSKTSANNFDKTRLLNINFDLKTKELYEKLPVLDRNGERFRIAKENFKDFLCTIIVYQDFQQKTKFAKLKKLRKAQNDLPIAMHRNEIIEKLKCCRVMLIAGDTGCGKSTQVPQYVLDAGYNKIVCTQPRRIACVSLAKRVAHETLTDYTSTIGYQIRFEKTKRKDTAIIFMTEGLLLRQASEEDTLNSYDVIILDEVHERHLHGDFLVGVMKCLLYKREDLKLILMSATINLKLFTEYFANENLEVIQVPGRLYPIEIHYKPIIKDPYDKNKDRFDCTPYLQILQMIDEKYPPNQKGDLLIFLNGFSEINSLCETINEYAERKKNWIVLPLHSTLSLEEQDRVFDYPPEGIRKCIISTNIAETSVTIDGVRFVIDSGKMNRMSYLSDGGVNRLAECNISQDSARQRAGRAGRTGPGTCFRFYSEEDFKSFDVFAPAEIHLVPLESLLLHMISLGLNDISNFPFLDKPSNDSIEESMEKLKFCGALIVDGDGVSLTSLGEKLSRLPVDLTIGKMLILSTVFENVNSVLAVAALLSIQSPFTQTASRNLDAEELRKRLDSNHGDPITLLNLYKEWLKVKRSGENSKIWARKRCLEEQRFYEVTKLLEQFRDILVESDLLPKIAEEELSSAERSIRHGELKKLRSIRNDLKNKSKSSQRKYLKLETFEAEKDDGAVDLRDVEFKITNDHRRLEKLLLENSANSYKDLMKLKIVLATGLYPQIAVEDEHNCSKTVNEKLYHAKNKNYVFLRPMSIFTLYPDILDLHNDDVEIPPPGYFSKRPISKKHQILIYQSILKTKKIYLVNVMRMPGLQTLLLLSKTIATNATLTKFVFDDFLALDVPYVGQGKTLLKTALDLRKKWLSKLEAKLSNYKVEDDPELVDDLIKFMSSEVSYNIKRLLPADVKVIYSENTDPFEEDVLCNMKNPFDRDFVIKKAEKMGGVRVSENVIYNCLIQEEWDAKLEEEMYSLEFQCPNCAEIMTGLSFFRMFQHESFCEKAEVKIEKKRTDIQPKANSKLFVCNSCGEELMLTPVEILKHKKGCGGT
ncbi:helicase [Oryctes borbonicus]|uniref:Helicase n=1 Tax=Oryctes borbonicus TaxID=1629725 RepID=A0A0T6BH42_9SCAR|nr:helicase [Oryctes borbonicus]